MAEAQRYYYYALERGCVKHPDTLDELGVGIHDGAISCALTIRLHGQMNDPSKGPQYGYRFSMSVSVFDDEWNVFAQCPDVLQLLSNRVTPSGEMKSSDPFYALRADIEKLGYKNLGPISQPAPPTPTPTPPPAPTPPAPPDHRVPPPTPPTPPQAPSNG